MAYPPAFGTWRELIVWLADEYHDGKLYAMARHLGRAPALLYQWRDGITKQPGLDSVELIARTYGIDRSHVMDMALGRGQERATPIRRRSRKPTPIAGGSDNGDYRPVAKSAPIQGIMSNWPWRLAA